MKRNLTCIVCPLGCSLEANIENGKVISVTGNTCPRGEAYARKECINPMRIVTSTVRCADGRVVSVKTNRPIPKEKVFECMQMIQKAKPDLPIRIGCVIIEKIFGADIVATQNAE